MKDEEKWDNSQKKYIQTGRRVANDTPNGRDGEWVARKRAFRDLFNQIADLRLKLVEIPGAEVVDDGWQFEGDPNAIDGEFVVTEEKTETNPVINPETGEVTTPSGHESDTGRTDDPAPAGDDLNSIFWTDDKTRLTNLRNKAALLWGTENKPMVYAHVYARLGKIIGSEARPKDFPTFATMMQNECAMSAEDVWQSVLDYETVGGDESEQE
jgi:hypothetical protein